MHGLLWFIGVSPVPDGTSPMYQLWSGFVPALAILSLVGGLWSHYKRINCHVHGCWRIGRYDVEGFKVCHAHHPDEQVKRGGVEWRHLLSKAGEPR